MIDLPYSIGSLQDLKRRSKKAFEQEALWHSQLEDAYEYFLPNRNLFESKDKGQKKMERIFDSTSVESIQLGASKLQENIAPIWSRWANLEPRNEIRGGYL